MTTFAVILMLLGGFLTIGVGVNAGSMHSSDAAGDGLAQGFALVLSISLWIVLAALLLIIGASGGFPGFSGVAMLLAFPLAVAGQMFALRLLTESKMEGAAAVVLPIVIVAGPVLLIIRAAWGILPPVRASVPELAGSWAPILLLVLVSLVPFRFLAPYSARQAAAQREKALLDGQNQQERKAQPDRKAQDDQRIQETLARIAALPSDSSLFSAIVFCADPEPAIRDAARAKARSFTKRQAEAEEFLAQEHEATLRELPNFDIAATPTVCASSKKILAAKGALKPFDNDPVRIEDAEREVAPYLDTMRWLLAHGCDCKSEISGLEQAVGRFANSPRREKLLAGLAEVKSAH